MGYAKIVKNRKISKKKLKKSNKRLNKPLKLGKI